MHVALFLYIPFCLSFFFLFLKEGNSIIEKMERILNVPNQLNKVCNIFALSCSF